MANGTRISEYLTEGGTVDTGALSRTLQEAVTRAGTVTGPTEIPPYVKTLAGRVSGISQKQENLRAERARMLKRIETKKATGFYPAALSSDKRVIPIPTGVKPYKPTQEARLASGKAAMTEWEDQVTVAQTAATQTAAALGVGGAGYLRGFGQLEAAAQKVMDMGTGIADQWAAISTKAMKFVGDAAARIGSGIQTITGLVAQATKDRSFAKAHDIEVAAYQMTGSLKEAERALMASGESDDKKIMQLGQLKTQTLDVAIKSIHGLYQGYAEQMNQSLLNTSAQYLGTATTNLAFQEQYALQVDMAGAAASAAIGMQKTEFDLTRVALEGTMFEGLMTLIDSVPIVSTSFLPLVTHLKGLAEEADLQKMAWKQLELQESAIKAEKKAATYGAIGSAVGGIGSMAAAKWA